MSCFDVVLDVVTVMSSSLGIWATLNTTYRCNSPVSFNVGGVTATFRNMRLEAYMPGNDLSPTGTAPTVSAVQTSGFSLTAIDPVPNMFHHRERLHGRPGHYHTAISHHHQHHRSDHNRSGADPSWNT